MNYILTVLVVILPGSEILLGWKTQFLLGGFSSEGIGERLAQVGKGNTAHFTLNYPVTKGS